MTAREQLTREVGKNVIRALRFVIDMAVMFLAFSLQYAASGNLIAAIITSAAVVIYGCWCFFDGFAARGERGKP